MGLLIYSSLVFLGFAPNSSAQTEASVVQLMPKLFYFESAQDLQRYYERSIEDLEKRIKKLVEIPDGRNFLLELDRLFGFFGEKMASFHLAEVALADSKLREEASRLQLRAYVWWNKEVIGRIEIHRKLRHVEVDMDRLAPKERRLLDGLQSNFRHWHSADSDSEESKLLAQQSAINRIQLSQNIEIAENLFQRNINMAKATLIFAEEDLRGVPLEYIKDLKLKDGRYQIEAAEWWQFDLIMRSANSATTRRRTYRARESIAAQINDLLIPQILELRRRLALTSGVSNWATYQLEGLVFESPKELRNFLLRAEKRNRPKFIAEQTLIRKMKSKRMGRSNPEIYLYDVAYYLNEYVKDELAVDLVGLRDYLEFEHVLQVIFEQMETSFHLKIKRSQVKVWDQNVLAYDVYERESGTRKGRIYIDPFPRDGKDKWFFSLSLNDRFVDQDGRVHIPSNLIVANYPPASEGAPALLSMEDVETQLHELGHSLHQILTNIDYASLSGMNSQEDITETPSKFLEVWMRDTEFLSKLLVHHKTGERLEPEAINKVIEALRVGSAHRRQGQIAKSILDLELHEAENSTQSARQIEQKIYAKYFYPLDEKSFPLTSFSHLFGGYDSLFWIYELGSTLAERIENLFLSEAGSILDPAMSARYRERFLSQGGIQLSRDLIADLFEMNRNSCAKFFNKLGSHRITRDSP